MLDEWAQTVMRERPRFIVGDKTMLNPRFETAHWSELLRLLQSDYVEIARIDDLFVLSRNEQASQKTLSNAPPEQSE